MSDPVETLSRLIANYSAKECAEVLEIIELHIDLTQRSVQDAAMRIENALTEPYRQTWTLFMVNRRHELAELEQLRKLLLQKISS